MVFASPVFLFIFLPAVLAAYYLSGKRNIVLLLSSLFFYAWGEPVYLLLMLFSIAVNWFLALKIGRSRRKCFLVSAVVLNLALLAVFKYADMFLSCFNGLFRANLPLGRIALPLGISFYTFQILSYDIDVWRGDIPAEKSLLTLGTYISMFPQLIAGPIVRYSDIRGALAGEKRITLSAAAEGARRFCLGLGKKVIIANVVSQCADLAFDLGGELLGAGAAWAGAACYALQIYYDFSGYSDMAIGLGGMLGFRFPENFRYPYLSGSVREFWRRWHITLSVWFRDYLYIPLGGNRRGAARTMLNLLIVFALCGLWHGADWSFAVWGLYHGLFLALERLPVFRKKLPKAAGIPLTLVIVTAGWVIFRADSLGAAWSYLRAMAGFGGSLAVTDVSGKVIWAAAAAGVLGCFPWLPLLKRKASENARLNRVLEFLSVLSAAAVLALCVLLLVGGTYNPFIYFRF